MGLLSVQSSFLTTEGEGFSVAEAAAVTEVAEEVEALLVVGKAVARVVVVVVITEERFDGEGFGLIEETDAWVSISVEEDKEEEVMTVGEEESAEEETS